jgi:hypothetical protein
MHRPRCVLVAGSIAAFLTVNGPVGHVQAAPQSDNRAALNGLTECQSRRIARTEKWKEVSAGGGFALELPEGFEPLPAKERQYVHGGQRWARGNVTVEMVWGTWGRGSFEKSSVFCRTEIGRLLVMLIQPKATDKPNATAWYLTGTIHEPIVSAWSSQQDDASLVEAIVRAGSRRADK